VDKKGVAENELISMMIGRDIDALYAQRQPAREGRGAVFWRLSGIGKKNSISDVDLQIRENEIVGVFGLEGSGTNELSRIMFGLEQYDWGAMELDGALQQRVSPRELLKKRIVYLSRNRKKSGLFFDMEAYNNIGCPILKRFARLGLLDRRQMQKFAAESIRRFGIVIPSVNTKPRYLSGGNQQKLMLSICLGTRPRCIIINEPTRGIDVGAKVEVHRLIRELVDGGTSVVVFSSELPELVSLCHRVLVMKNKRTVGELSGDKISEEAIMTYAAGGER
jgi:ABC-type sugar transport system ATPase subunit